MEPSIGDNIPQWKKDLIARLKNQNKTAFGSKDQHSAPHHSSAHRTGHQPNLTTRSVSVTSDVSRQVDASVADLCNVTPRMVQERVWIDNKNDHFPEMVGATHPNNGYYKDSESDSSEELHYGPGIVKKLKNKYLSLALRESNNRMSILHMRKATSLENLLDDNIEENKNYNGQYESRVNGSSMYRKAPTRNSRKSNRQQTDVKRARSVEAISRLDSQINDNVVVANRQSLHEEMLIAAQKEGSDHPYNKMSDNDAKPENKYTQKINRPKRLQPIMSEKEKPPADVVKQAKLIFERRPEQRTKKPPQTGDVAAKVDSFNNIIVKAKCEAKISRKPQIKSNKPNLNEKQVSRTNNTIKQVPSKHFKLPINNVKDVSMLSPIPDVSRILPGESDRRKQANSLSETPDLILTSSPLSSLHMQVTDNSIKEEVKHKEITSPMLSPNRIKPASPLISPIFNKPTSSPTKIKPPIFYNEDDTDNGIKKISPTSIKNISRESESIVFNLKDKEINQDHLPINKNVSEIKIPTTEPLKIEINGHGDNKPEGKVLKKQRSPPKFNPPPPPVIEKILTIAEIEKNSINATKSTKIKPSVSADAKNSVEVVNKNVVPKKRTRPKEPASDSSTLVITFVGTERKVPDYIANDKSRTATKPELPKPGEGGIILIPGATILESFTDEDEEILRSLEGPPSPCDVTFINDNVLIDGKSSQKSSQKMNRAKLKISFVDSNPDIYEYPSENSLMLDESPLLSPVQLGHTVPNLSGSSLANYKPKGTEKFQPGVTKTIPQTVPSPTKTEALEPEPDYENDKPFSSGTNADILF